MKTLIVLVVGLLSVGCLTPEQKQKDLRDSVVGEYEWNQKDGTTRKLVFLKNGIVERYRYGRKSLEYKWSIVDGEIHIKVDDGSIAVYRINADKSITWIASIYNGKRTPLSIEEQTTWIKLK